MMQAVQITISNDPATLGDAATREDLEAYAQQLADELGEEFDCDVYYSLDSGLRSTVRCGDANLQSAIEDRLLAIERGDEWIQVLARSATGGQND